MQIQGKSKAAASVADGFARGGGGAVSEISGIFFPLADAERRGRRRFRKFVPTICYAHGPKLLV